MRRMKVRGCAGGVIIRCAGLKAGGVRNAGGRLMFGVRTMNMGGPRGAVGRWAVRPVSWVVVGAGVVGMLLVLLVSRFPVRGVDSWFVDFRGDPSWNYWQARWAAATWGEMVFAVGIVVWLVVLLGWWGGGIVRYFAARRFRAAGPFRRVPRRHLLLIVMFLVTLVMAGVGWPFRVGEGIVGRELATKGNSFWTPNFPAAGDGRAGTSRSVVRFTEGLDTS